MTSDNAHYVNKAEADGTPPRDAVIAMRHLRKLAKSRAYTRKVEVTRSRIVGMVEVVDEWTGEITDQPQLEVYTRRVTRKVAYLAGRQTGFLAVNDGPSTARDIARVLWNVEGPGQIARAQLQLVA